MSLLKRDLSNSSLACFASCVVEKLIWLFFHVSFCEERGHMPKLLKELPNVLLFTRSGQSSQSTTMQSLMHKQSISSHFASIKDGENAQ
jgi:hypothetical protein